MVRQRFTTRRHHHTEQNTNGKTCAYPRDCQSADAARTDEMPFSVGNETGRVAAAVALQLQVDTARVVRPRAELQLVVMVREILADRQTDRPRAHAIRLEPNFISHSWSSNGNHVMSILHVLRNRPGGTQRQSPDDDTTTFVGNVLSMSSSALYAQPRHIDNMQLRLIIMVILNSKFLQ